MQLNVWNDLAKAKRRWTEKNSHNGMAMWFLCLCFPFCLVSPHQYLSWYNAITSFSSIVIELDRRSLSSLCFWCLFFVWLCFCVFCCFGCFLVVGCVFVWNRDGCIRSHTSSLLCHLPMAAICMHQLANLPVLCNMQSNVLNDLAKAKRRWTEKKLSAIQASRRIPGANCVIWRCVSFTYKERQKLLFLGKSKEQWTVRIFSKSFPSLERRDGQRFWDFECTNRRRDILSTAD